MNQSWKTSNLTNDLTAILHAFFDEPQAPTLEAFVRVTASHLFLELGVFEGGELQQIFEQQFPRSGVIDIISGNVQFWGLNVSGD